MCSRCRCRRCASATRGYSGAGGAFHATGCEAERLEAEAVSADAIDELQRYRWPGNVRELRNVVERLLLLSGDAGGRGDVRWRCRADGGGAGHRRRCSTGTLAERVDTFEREVLLAELKRQQPSHDGDRAKRWGWSAAIYIRSASSWESICRRCAKGKGIDGLAGWPTGDSGLRVLRLSFDTLPRLIPRYLSRR